MLQNYFEDPSCLTQEGSLFYCDGLCTKNHLFQMPLLPFLIWLFFLFLPIGKTARPKTTMCRRNRSFFNNQ